MRPTCCRSVVIVVVVFAKMVWEMCFGNQVRTILLYWVVTPLKACFDP